MSQLSTNEVVAVDPVSPSLRQIADRAADRWDTSPRAVHLQLLLHLPRLAALDATVLVAAAEAEADRLASRLPPASKWRLAQLLALEELEFAEVDEAVARYICRTFHYLGSHRPGAQSYALLAPEGGVVGLGVTAGCDVDRLRQLASAQLGDEAPRILARVFAFEGAPPNSLTRLFKLVAGAEQLQGHGSLLTYVNPNMGFTGASYRAGNWQLLGEEVGTTYRYLDGNYVTDRELARLFGRSRLDEARLRGLFGDRYQRSAMRLDPLAVYGRRL